MMIRLLIGILTVAAVVSAQTAAPQPQIKSQKEAEAVNAIFQAADANARLAAVQNLITKFADTQFKGLALYMATVTAQQLNDYEKMMLYAEQTLDADPKSYHTMIIMASGLATRTKEHDLDKEEKLGKAEKLANSAFVLMKDAPKPNPQLTDEQWAQAKKDFEAQGHEALGIISSARKKYEEAIKHFQAAVEAANDPVTMVRLAQNQNLAGKYDDAIATAEKVMAVADAPANVKSIAQAEKARAVGAKAAKK